MAEVTTHHIRLLNTARNLLHPRPPPSHLNKERNAAMVSLVLSVGVVNFIVFVFTKLLLHIMCKTSNSLMARHFVSKQLVRGKDVKFNPSPNLIDQLPCISDYRLASHLKIPLTLIYLAIVGVSVYITASVDGENAKNPEAFPVSSALFLGPRSGGSLISNSGEDINSMAKISCLRILNNNEIVLYKAFVGSDFDIICEDGQDTFSKRILFKAEIRAAFRTPKTGKDMQDMPIYNSTFGNEEARKGLELSNTALSVNKTDELGMVQDVATRIVLIERSEEEMCIFGIWRSAGDGFDVRVDIKLHASCRMQVAALELMLLPKADYLPPRMSFLYQVMDGILVSQRKTEVPSLRDNERVVATLPLATIIVGFATAALCMISAAALYVVVRCSKVQEDVSTETGVAAVLAAGMFAGTDSVVFRWDGEKVVCVGKEETGKTETGTDGTIA